MGLYTSYLGEAQYSFEKKKLISYNFLFPFKNHVKELYVVPVS